MGNLYKIAGTPGSSGINSSPTVIGETGDDVSLIIQGYPLDGATSRALGIPAGEIALRFPRSVFLEAARRIAED